ncbi:MAG TPA: fibronectin type III domain-containing protein [Thermoanaerobaculia bacterium]|nr:fibronectin type III domain-containing protein [Thermoanaerobaculia bacterium]
MSSMRDALHSVLPPEPLDFLRLAAVAGAIALAAACGAQAQMLIEHDVTVGSMVSDRFTWIDSSGQTRVAVLAHNDGQTGLGGTRGGELREIRYETPSGTRVVAASGSGASGFGYVVSHPKDDEETCIANSPDTSMLGHFLTGTFTRVFEGRHHAIFRFTQNYPRYCMTGAVAPGAEIDIPVTIEWVFSTGRDNPLWAVTWDLNAIAVDTLKDDARGPYGELLFDGAATEGGHSIVAGVGWGDRYKFVSSTNPVTMGSAWSWNTPNTVPYVKLWTSAVDATMGTVQTQPITQQDAGGYWGVGRWNTTSAGGNACTVAIGGVDHRMPCDFNWPYQSINYSFADSSSATNNTRLAWGTNFGFLGQSQYYTHGSAYYGGLLPNTTASGWPRKSYATYVVLGRHSDAPVESQVAQVETMQSVTATASVGTVLTMGPAGVARPDNVTYVPAGYNHVYGALAFSAAANQLDVNVAVGAGTLSKPLMIVSNYTAGYPAGVTLNGATLNADTDYYASLRPAASELWITLNRNLTGASNRIQISSTTRLAAPHNLAATASSTTQVGLTWSSVPGASGYEIWRSSGNTAFAFLTATGVTSYSDSGLSANTTYLYEVLATGGGGQSEFSAVDPATTILFTDDPLNAGILIKAVHVEELRTAVNAMRVAGGLFPVVFSDSPITSTTVIQAAHLSELRIALDQARSAIGVSKVMYSDSTLMPGVTVVKAAHVADLRSGVK